MNLNLKKIPACAGVYLFKGSKERVLYVGKAKNLRNRLRSYFQNSANLDDRKRRMVKIIKDFSYIATSNELEALILEATLIKQYKPKYNIILRDDKNYPYIKLTIKEKWPKIEVVRGVERDGNLYFGPYIPAQGMWEAIDFIGRNFLLRTCKYSLERHMRPCVQYQMNKCLAPCAKKVSRDEYLKIVEDVRLFLAGEKKELISILENKMTQLSEQLRFEEAARIRDGINNIKRAFDSQKVISPELEDLDAIGYYKQGSDIVIQVLFIKNGVLIGAKEFFINNLITDEESEIMHSFIELFYSKDIIVPPVILTNCIPENSDSLLAWLKNKRGNEVAIEVPEDPKRLAILTMANENARLLMNSKMKSFSDFDKIISNLKEKLSLKKSPASIGAFDVSTIQGEQSVGAYIFWEKDEFKKQEYRHFKIKDVAGVDDYAMIREIVKRTFNKADIRLPELIIIDGGMAQLSVAKGVIDEMNLEIPIISVAKRPDRAFSLNGKVIHLDDKSPESDFLKRIRDEVHRFAITYHRKMRARKLLDSPLENISGIGKKRRLELLRHFGSIDNIRKASAHDIMQIKGFNKKISDKILEELKKQTG